MIRDLEERAVSARVYKLCGNSYSADRIAGNQPIREPFQFEGDWWCSTSGQGGGAGRDWAWHEAYRLRPAASFDGPTNPYNDHDWDRVRGTAFAYHGMTVKWGRETMVLVGPCTRFTTGGAQQREPVQGDLFA